jgi:hypothetical protein
LRPEPTNDSMVMISFDACGVARNVRPSGAARDRVRGPARDHHYGVVLTDRNDVW